MLIRTAITARTKRACIIPPEWNPKKPTNHAITNITAIMYKMLPINLILSLVNNCLAQELQQNRIV